MLFRKLGHSGPLVSAMGYGCMGMSEFYGATLDKHEAISLIRSAYQELEVTFFDTADMYGKGLSEEMLGEAVKPFRDKIVIATKCGIKRTEDDMSLDNSRNYVKAACDASLKRLETDYIDIFFLHRHDQKTPIEEPIMAMKELIQEGKVHYVGLSEVNADIIKKAHAILGDRLVAVETEYSLTVQNPANAVLPICRELGIGFVAYSPIARGFLTNTINSPLSFADDDFRNLVPQFQAGCFEENYKIVEKLTEIAKDNHLTTAQLSLGWLLAQGEDIIPIPGTTKFAHLKENVAATDALLTPETMRKIDTLMGENAVKGARLPQEILDALKMAQ
ncbi:MAG: aldo/keto reductase [marine bacterium B5-7]|nr:MAG: aldo/keto reductase [marine bacterium B5-7]